MLDPHFRAVCTTSKQAGIWSTSELVLLIRGHMPRAPTITGANSSVFPGQRFDAASQKNGLSYFRCLRTYATPNSVDSQDTCISATIVLPSG
jgi:hypothetical protein